MIASVALIALVSLVSGQHQQYFYGQLGTSPPLYYVVPHTQASLGNRQVVVHPNQPANVGQISSLPAGTPEQQNAWDNAAPVVIRSNNQSPQQQFFYVVSSSAFNHLNRGQNRYNVPAVGGGQQYYVVDTQSYRSQVGQGGQQDFYGVAGNVNGDTVVTNDQAGTATPRLPSVNFDNLRPGNVRRLEEPAVDSLTFHDDEEVVTGGRVGGGTEAAVADNGDSGSDVGDLSSGTTGGGRFVGNAGGHPVSGGSGYDQGKTNVQPEQRREEQQPQVVKSPAALGRRQQPVKSPQNPTQTGFRFGQRRVQQPYLAETRVWNYGTKSRAQGLKGPAPPATKNYHGPSHSDDSF